MKRLGFGRGEADDIGGLTYHRRNQFVTVDYSVEDRPTYSPHVEIGFTRTRSRRFRSYARWLVGGSTRPIGLDRFPLWYAIPSDSQQRDYERWRYSNEAELRQALTRLRDEVVEIYARPLWENPQKLHNWIARFSLSSQFNRAKEIEDEMLRRAKKEADEAFGSCDYRKAAAVYSRIGVAKLGPVERKRLELSKKYRS